MKRAWSGKTILGILLAASLSGNVAFLLTASLHASTPHPTPLERLELTGGQKSRLEASQRAFQQERKRSHARMSELRRTIADELSKDAPNRRRLMDASMEMARVQTDLRPKVVDHLLAFHALLTPAQRAVLAEIMRTGPVRGAGCPGAGLYSDQEK